MYDIIYLYIYYKIYIQLAITLEVSKLIEPISGKLLLNYMQKNNNQIIK